VIKDKIAARIGMKPMEADIAARSKLKIVTKDRNYLREPILSWSFDGMLYSPDGPQDAHLLLPVPCDAVPEERLECI